MEYVHIASIQSRLHAWVASATIWQELFGQADNPGTGGRGQGTERDVGDRCQLRTGKLGVARLPARNVIAIMDDERV